MASSFDQIIGQYMADPAIGGNVATPVKSKMDEVRITADSKKAALSGNKVPYYNVAAARQRGGTGLSTITDPVQSDLARLNNWDLVQKYGAEETARMFSDYNAGSAGYNADLQTASNPTFSQPSMRDAGLGVAQGLINSVLGIPAAGAGIVSSKAGVAAGKGIGKINEFIDSYKSPAAANRKRLFGVVNSLDIADNSEQYKTDKTKDGNFIASLKKIGRDTLDTGVNALSDPETLKDTLAQGAGSLLAAGPLTKGLAFAGKAATPLAIGAMEGGGAYQQSIMDAYDTLKDRTDLTEDQKNDMANRAGLEAAAIQAPIAALTGTLVSKFEANPFARVTAKTAIRNTAKEGLEEGLQSASGQLAQNKAATDQFDPNRDITEGVGEQTALGIIGGIGSAGLIEAPHIAAGATVAAGKLAARGAVNGAKKLYGALEARNARVLDQVAEQSPASAKVMNQEATDASVAAPVVRENVTQAVQNNENLTPEERDELVTHFNRVMSFDPSEADNKPAILADAIRGSQSRVEAVQHIAAIAGDTNQAPEDRLMAGLYLKDAFNRNDNMLENIPATVEKMSDDDEAIKQLNGYQDVLQQLPNNPAIREAIQAAMEFSKNITPESVSNPDTPEGQKNIQTAVDIASLDPANSNPEVNKQILFHSEQGKYALTPEQKGALVSVNALRQAETKHQEESKSLGLTDSEVVSNQIQTDLKDPNTLHKSAMAHMEGIVNAVSSGNTDLASNRLRHFMNFNQSMQNKIAALNESFRNGGEPVKYQAYNPRTGQFFESLDGAYAKPGSRGSIGHAQQANIDAEAVAYIANEISKAYPQLGIKPINSTQLDPALMQAPAREIARDQMIAERDAKNIKSESAQQKTRPEEPVQNEPPRTQDRTESVEPSVREEQAPQSQDLLQQAVARNEKQASGTKDPEPQQQSETVKVEEKVEPEKPASGIDGAYPNLLGSEGKSLLGQTFTLPDGEVAPSRLSTRDDAVTAMRKALSSVEKFIEFTGNSKTGKKLTSDVARAYSKYLRIVNDLSKQLNSQLEEALDFKKLDAEKLSDPSVMGREENRALAIVENQDGKLSYNSALQQGAALGAMQWMLNLDQRSRTLKPEDVAKILNIPEALVTDDEVQLFNQGAYFADAIVDLGDLITKFWGMKTNRDAPEAFTKGIPEAVAKEMVVALDQMGMIKINEFKVRDKPYIQLSFEAKKEEAFKAVLDQLVKAPSMIEAAALTEPTEILYVGEVPPSRGKYQLRNPNVPLTAQQSEMRDREEATPHYAHMPMVSLVRALGQSGLQALFGHGDLENQKLNAEHKKSLEGMNIGIAAAFDTIERVLAQLEHTAGIDGVDVDKVPLHYTYDFTSVNRLQMNGSQNPQANKITREVFMPTQSTLDLTDPVNMDRFMLGIAQAWGKKVHRQSRSVSVKQVQDLVSGSYAPMIKAIQDWMSLSPAEQAQESVELSNLIRTTLDPKKGSPAPVVAVMAAMEYARYLNSEDKSKFTTPMYVEADGVTDGPINAMVHMARGAFTQGWLKTVAKGGLFLKSGRTINDYASTPDGSVDLYQQTTDYLKNNLNALWKGNPDARQDIENLTNLMGELNFNMSIGDDGKLTIERGAVKNPLTVKIYGSGDDGIGSKIRQLLIKAIYERESEILQSTSNKEGLSKYRDYLTSIIGKSQFGEEFKFTDDQIQDLEGQLKELFVKPMSDAIGQSIGETQHSVTAIRQATQVMSIVFRDAFQAGIEAKLQEKAKDPNWKRSYFLSQKELQEVYDANKHLAPYIQTGTQNILVSGNEKVPFTSGSKNSPVYFSRSLPSKANSSGRLATSAYTRGPVESGVSGIPFTVIATGDGQMMQSFSVDTGPGSKHLLIFDGANFALDQLEENSELINKAVYDGWTKNPFSHVADMFDRFMENDGQKLVADLSEKSRKEIQSNLGQDNDLGTLRETMNEIAQEITARKAVLARIGMTVDHMASAEAPFVANPRGEYLGDLTDEQAVARMNEMFDEELRKLRNEDITPEKTEAQVTENSSVEGKEIIRLVVQNKNTDPYVTIMARQLAADGHRIVLGSVDALQREAGVDLPSGSNTKGFYSPETKTLYISEQGETLVHEMVHAATVQSVWDYYSNAGNNLTSEQKAAVQRLESMMQEWLDLTANGGSTAINNARQAILDYLKGDTLDAVKKTSALNEFMAWNLSNQDLKKFNASKTTTSALRNIVGRVMEAIKNLIGNPGNNFLKNLQFNTALLLDNTQTVQGTLKDTILYQSEAFGNNDRLTDLDNRFFDKVVRYLNQQVDPTSRLTAEYKIHLSRVKADEVQASFDAHGWPMDMQQASTFKMMLTALGTEMDLNTNSLARVQDLYAHVTKNITPENFKTNVGDPDADQYQAQEKYNSIMGTNLVEIDEKGRSSLLPAFLALAMVDDGFRDVVSKIDLPKTEKLPGTTLDNHLTNIGSEMMDRLGVLMSGEGINKPSVQAALDVLTDKILDVAQDRKGYIDQFMSPLGNASDKVNTFVSDGLSTLAQKANEKLTNISENSSNKIVKSVADMGKYITGIFDKDLAGDNSVALMSAFNKMNVWTPIHEFMNEMVGRTRENASVYDMIKAVRSAIQQMRQQYREHLPEVLAKRFSRPLTDAEHTATFKGLAKTDLASLSSGYSIKQINEILTDPVKMANELKLIEGRISGSKNGSKILAKARDLASYMTTGKVPADLLRNAHAIERLTNKSVRTDAEVNTNMVRDIDHLVSLYALEGLNQDDRNTLASLVQNESEGVSFMLSYLDGVRRDELRDIENNPVALLNHYKGYVPSLQEGKAYGRTLIVADDDQFLDLRQRGFNRVSDYDGVGADRNKKRKGYYYSTLSGRSSYNQGIVQTVHVTASGIDPVTGFTAGEPMTAGKITDPEQVRRIEKLLSRSQNQGQNQNGNEQLMPIYDRDGNVVAYERSVDPVQLERLGKSTNLMNMLGVWRGRQMEEVLAQKYNDSLVERLHNIWNKEELTRKNEYVNLFDTKALKDDPVVLDAVKLIPRETRAKIAELYGPNEFWVRRDMLNDAIGYRKASIGDVWTGNTRFSEETQKNIRGLATNVFGIDAYKKMVTAEKLYQNFITDARVLIVVKSVIVPVGNLIANVYQLSGRGVPIADTLRNMPKKTAEVDTYTKQRIRVMEIDAEIHAAEGAKDLVAQRKLKVQKQSIEDNWKRLSIWPLIEAGELSSISDVGVGKEEIDLTEGRLNQYIEKLTDKLPDAVKTAGKYAIVGKDTALFKGLQKAVEYGDFLAKAILYDDLVKRQKKTHEEALAAITEEYVNYDRLAGRGRDYIDSMGLSWFLNFKIRSVKIALSMLRNNPVHALMTMLVPPLPLLGSVGNPLTDNFVSVLADGRLGNSIGPGQGLRAHTLNPWIQLVG